MDNDTKKEEYQYVPRKREPEEPASESPVKSFIQKAFIVIIVAAILLLIAFGIIKVAPTALNSLANISVSVSSIFQPKEHLTIATPPRVQSGQETTLTWTHASKTGNGIYSISYPCTNNVYLHLTAGTEENVSCGKDTNIGSTTQVSFLPISDQVNQIDLPITVSYKRDPQSNAVSLSANTILNITNPHIPVDGGGLVVGTPTPTPIPNTGLIITSPSPTPANSNTTPSPTPVVTNGKADLSVSVLEVGVIDKLTGIFIPQQSIAAGERAAVRFQVENIGTGASGSYHFTALIPAEGTKTFNSDAERSLNAGDKEIFTLAFDNLNTTTGANVMTITVDPQNVVPETRKDNNVAKLTFVASGVTTGGGTTGNGTLADLSVRIMDTGSVDRSSAVYIPKSQVLTTDKAAIRFEVTNIGGTATGAWTFTATLPSSTNPNYISGQNASLAPGQKAVFVIGFDNIYNTPQNTAVITINSNNQVAESRRDNNTASAYMQTINNGTYNGY